MWKNAEQNSCPFTLSLNSVFNDQCSLNNDCTWMWRCRVSSESFFGCFFFILFSFFTFAVRKPFSGNSITHIFGSFENTRTTPASRVFYFAISHWGGIILGVHAATCNCVYGSSYKYASRNTCSVATMVGFCLGLFNFVKSSVRPKAYEILCSQ